MAPIESVLKGMHFFIVGFSGGGHYGHGQYYCRNGLSGILCVFQNHPIGGRCPRSKMFLRAGTFSQLDFRGCALANIIIEIDSQEYNVYFRTIRQREYTPDPKCSRGQALFRKWIFGGCAVQGWLGFLLKWTLRNIICISEPLDRGHKPLIETVLEAGTFRSWIFGGGGR